MLFAQKQRLTRDILWSTDAHATASGEAPMRPFDPSARQRMPLLDWAATRAGEAEPLRGWHVLFLQHQLENHLPQAEVILDLGVRVEEFHWMDIPYTSSSEIREELIQRRGIPRANFICHDYSLEQRYNSYQRLRVIHWINAFIKAHGVDAPLLVLDDGGYFLEAMICLRQHLKRLVIVEQTTRGIIKYNHNAAIRYYCSQVPVINIAESRPKKQVEPAFISAAVCGATMDKIANLPTAIAILRQSPRVLVMGYGAIGKAVATDLVERIGIERTDVHVFDVNEEAQQLALSHGFSAWDRSEFKGGFGGGFGIVVGCTGTCSFNMWDYVHLAPESLLISASSGASELAREDFVEYAQATDSDDVHVLNPEGLEVGDIHADIRLQVIDHTIHIANGGFPVNFDGHLNRIPAEQMQITQAMMVYGAIQAVRSIGQGGLVPLDEVFADELIEKFSELQRQPGNRA
jgi:S-adenosylhomocysteine hydrolase